MFFVEAVQDQEVCGLGLVGYPLSLGFLGYYLASFLDFAGLAYITATLERLILYLTPTLVALIGWLAFGRRITRRQALALLVSYAGVALAFLSYRKSVQTAIYIAVPLMALAGIGNLVDADMAKESARLQALQVQQQLGAQALSIANQAPQIILSLFKG